MSMERATALVLRTTDWSESSRIATLWTRELGKVRVLAKGGRRLKSSFDSALDLLTVCGIVLIRKSSGSLDLLTEAQVVRRFARLSEDLSALYAAYFVAELLADWTEELDPHPDLFDQALTTLDALATVGSDVPLETMRFEMVFLGEMGYRPVLDRCATCQRRATGAGLSDGVPLAELPRLDDLQILTGRLARRPLADDAEVDIEVVIGPPGRL